MIIRGLNFDGVGSGLDGIRFASGAQLSVEQCFIFGFTQNGIEVALAAGADVYITNTYITNVNKGIFANTTTGVTIVSVSNTNVLNVNANGFEAQNGIIATVTGSAFTSAANGVMASGASQINVESSTLINNGVGINASVGNTTIRVSNNSMYNNGTNFNYNWSDGRNDQQQQGHSRRRDRSECHHHAAIVDRSRVWRPGLSRPLLLWLCCLRIQSRNNLLGVP